MLKRGIGLRSDHQHSRTLGCSTRILSEPKITATFSHCWSFDLCLWNDYQRSHLVCRDVDRERTQLSGVDLSSNVLWDNSPQFELVFSRWYRTGKFLLRILMGRGVLLLGLFLSKCPPAIIGSVLSLDQLYCSARRWCFVIAVITRLIITEKCYSEEKMSISGLARC